MVDCVSILWWHRVGQRKWLAVAVLLVIAATGGVFCGRGELLPIVAGVLVTDEQAAASSVVYVESGDRRYEVAAGLYREDPSRTLLLIEECAQRVMRHGILLTNIKLDRRELAKRGVPEQALEVVSGQSARTHLHGKPGRSGTRPTRWRHGWLNIVRSLLSFAF